MPLQIIRNDITKMEVDAIVNAAKPSLLGGGGVDGCIHRAAGPSLLEECRTLGGCKTGEAKITGAGNLPCRYVIHTVGPVWHGGEYGEREKLASCYRSSLTLASENGCETVAFPLISAGAYHYPQDQALRVAVDTISEFLFEHEMTVYLVIFNRSSYQIGEKLFGSIAAYIDDTYIDPNFETQLRERQARYEEIAGRMRNALPPDVNRLVPPPEDKSFRIEDLHVSYCFDKKQRDESYRVKSWRNSLENAIDQRDESFTEMLLRKIDESGMSDAECYKKANIDRRLFSKIRSDTLYKPKKTTALAFAIALELSLDETKDLLMKAGFALSHSSVFDIIVEYFIRQHDYNINNINEALFAFDQSLLGC